MMPHRSPRMLPKADIPGPNNGYNQWMACAHFTGAAVEFGRHATLWPLLCVISNDPKSTICAALGCQIVRTVLEMYSSTMALQATP